MDAFIFHNSTFLLHEKKFYQYVYKLESLNFVDANSSFTQLTGFVFHRVTNIMGKGENAGYQHFLLFTQCFQ